VLPGLLELHRRLQRHRDALLQSPERSPKHAAFAVGDLAQRQSIFDVYAGREFTAWRRSLVTVGEKADPCRTCQQKALEGPALERLGRAVDAKLSAIGVDVS